MPWGKRMHWHVMQSVLLVGVLIGMPELVGCAATRGAQSGNVAAARQSARPNDPMPRTEGETDVQQVDAPRPVQDWGVEPMSLRLSAAGYMLDFRYRVMDPEKSAPLMDRRVKPILIHEATGTRMFVPNPPKVGPLRQTSRTPGTERTFFMVFANPGRFVKAGDTVTVEVGDCSIPNLVVQ